MYWPSLEGSVTYTNDPHNVNRILVSLAPWPLLEAPMASLAGVLALRRIIKSPYFFKGVQSDRELPRFYYRVGIHIFETVTLTAFAMEHHLKFLEFSSQIDFLNASVELARNGIVLAPGWLALGSYLAGSALVLTAIGFSNAVKPIKNLKAVTRKFWEREKLS